MRRNTRPTTSLSNSQILVAHPSARMASLICSALRMVGVVDAKRVVTSQAARNALLSGAYDAAIVSFDLKPDGPAALAHRLRLDAITVPIVAISTTRDRIVLENSAIQDIDAVILRPVSAAVLGARLLAVIGQRGASRGEEALTSLTEI